MPSSRDSPGSRRMTEPSRLWQVAGLFLKLGALGFGGPAAHVAMMEDEVCRREWVSREEFLDLLGATNLIPGPNSTELAIHIGYRRAGRAGLILGGVCFILPACLIVTAAAWTYVRYGSLPQVDALLNGLKPAVIAIVLLALWRLGRTAIRSSVAAVVGGGSALLALLGVNELLVLLCGGLAVVLWKSVLTRRSDGGGLFALAPSSLPALLAYAPAGATAVSVGLWRLFLFFLKVGSVLFGSGYVLLAFLRADLVDRWHWLSETELLDAIAIGQVTPGPLFTTATFIGYLLGGIPGAVASTVGIFLPAFFFVAVSGPLVPRLRASAAAAAILDGIIAASLSLMAVVTWHLSRAVLIDWTALMLLAVSLVLLTWFRLSSAWPLLLGAVVGIIRMVV